MIDRSARSADQPTGEGSEHQPGQRLLSAPAGVRGRSRADAPDRRIASRISVRGQPDAADLLNAEGVMIGRRHVATLMKRMGIEAIYRKPNTSKPAPGHKIYPYLLRKLPVITAQPGLGDGYHLHPDGARLRLSCRRRRLVQPPGSRLAVVDHDGSGVLHRGAGGGPGPSWQAGDLQHRSGQPVHQRRLHRRSSQRTASRSAWMAKAPGATTSSSSGSGDPSNTRRSTCRPTTRSPRPAPRSAAIIGFYNADRPHSSLDRQTPDQAYFNRLPQIAAA